MQYIKVYEAQIYLFLMRLSGSTKALLGQRIQDFDVIRIMFLPLSDLDTTHLNQLVDLAKNQDDRS